MATYVTEVGPEIFRGKCSKSRICTGLEQLDTLLEHKDGSEELVHSEKRSIKIHNAYESLAGPISHRIKSSAQLP